MTRPLGDRKLHMIKLILQGFGPKITQTSPKTVPYSACIIDLLRKRTKTAMFIMKLLRNKRANENSNRDNRDNQDNLDNQNKRH